MISQIADFRKKFRQKMHQNLQKNTAPCCKEAALVNYLIFLKSRLALAVVSPASSSKSISNTSAALRAVYST